MCLSCLCRFASESFLTGASSTQLSTKLLSLLQDCICTHLFPELQRRLDKLKAAVTPQSKLLLKKGRRCANQSPCAHWALHESHVQQASVVCSSTIGM